MQRRVSFLIHDEGVIKRSLRYVNTICCRFIATSHSLTEVDERLERRRASFVLWLTSRDNSFFARAGVNWAWTHFFGSRLVDSLDRNFQPTNSINAQLLDDLAAAFVASGFDLQELLRTIASTRAYQLSGGQLSSGQGNPAAATPDLFARMLPRPLTPEQLYDSFLLLAPPAMSRSDRVDARNTATRGLAADPMRVQFIRQMREPPGSATEYRSGTLQALMLMNGVTAAALTAHDSSRLLGALTAPFLDDEERIEALFLATLCRRPDDEQQRMCLEELRAGKTQAERSRVLSDLLWALVNSTEFAFNR